MEPIDNNHDDNPASCCRRIRARGVRDDHTIRSKTVGLDYDNDLARHCDYFDIDSDGIIWPLDTYQVCRAWDWSFPVALFFAGAIHFVQSYGTISGLTPDPFWRIWKKNIRRNKHGSSTLSFGSDGAFFDTQLIHFFELNDMEKKGGLTKWDLWRGLKRQALPADLFGQVSTFFEWFFTYLLIWPKDGLIREEDARGVCDGKLFKARATGGVQHWRSSLLLKQVLSLLIVHIIILPAVVAGMCFYMLRAIDDVVSLWQYWQRTARKRHLKRPEKSSRGYPGDDVAGEGSPISVAGLVGTLLIAVIVKMVMR